MKMRLPCIELTNRVAALDAAGGSDIIGCSKFVERDSVAAFLSTAPRSPAYFPDRNGGPFHSRPEREISGDHACLETLVGNKLYVGNLSYNVTASQLQELFAQHGTVQSAEIINDRDTGRSKGFGFVEMGSDAEDVRCRQKQERGKMKNDHQPANEPYAGKRCSSMARHREEGQSEQSYSCNIRDFAQVQEAHLRNRSGK